MVATICHVAVWYGVQKLWEGATLNSKRLDVPLGPETSRIGFALSFPARAFASSRLGIGVLSEMRGSDARLDWRLGVKQAEKPTRESIKILMKDLFVIIHGTVQQREEKFPGAGHLQADRGTCHFYN